MLGAMAPARFKFRRLIILSEAAAALGFAWFRVRYWPFDRAVMPSSRMPGQETADCDVAGLIWAVEAASRRMPFRTKCLEQALALRFMLNRRGCPSILHYGIRHDEEGLIAHAWLSCHGRVLIGGSNCEQFHEVAAFGQATDR